MPPRHKPAELRLLEGNPGKRALPPPLPESPAPTRPEWLPPEAKREWTRMARAVAPLGMLRLTDRAMLAAYCEAWADFVAVCRELASRPLGSRYVTVTEKGNRMVEPLVTARKSAFERLKIAAREFGLTPSARVSIAPGGPKPNDDPADKFFSNAGRPGRAGQKKAN